MSSCEDHRIDGHVGVRRHQRRGQLDGLSRRGEQFGEGLGNGRFWTSGLQGGKSFLDARVVHHRSNPFTHPLLTTATRSCAPVRLGR